MRTKALLSVAAIAASAVTAMAQSNVYSLNIVGYATVSIPAGFSILANPLSAGTSNLASEIMTPIDGEKILTWNGSGYNSVNFNSLLGGWVDDSFNSVSPPALPPGVGFFFFNPGSTATNVTFVGQVVPNPGTNNANTLKLAPGFSMVGSPLPAAVTDITAAPVSFPTIDSSKILTWNGNGYTSYNYQTLLGGWVDDAFNKINPPAYSIGQGFFFFNPGSTAANWTQSLP